MRLIALETATEACSAALWIDGELHWLFERAASRRHGEMLLEQVHRLLAAAELSPTQLDAIAVGRGPGAFTGVRLGLGVAQGLAFATGIPVAPVSTLAALGQQAAERGAGEILAVLDARMCELYWALFYPDADGRVAAGHEFLSAPEGLSVDWRAGPRLALGSGFAAHPDLAARLGLDESEVDAAALPCAREVAILGAAACARGEAVPPEQAQPVYLRDRVAEPARSTGRVPARGQRGG